MKTLNDPASMMHTPDCTTAATPPVHIPQPNHYTVERHNTPSQRWWYILVWNGYQWPNGIRNISDLRLPTWHIHHIWIKSCQKLTILFNQFPLGDNLTYLTISAVFNNSQILIVSKLKPETDSVGLQSVFFIYHFQIIARHSFLHDPISFTNILQVF